MSRSKDRRRLREGQRQYGRSHIIPFAPMRQKDHLGGDLRRRPGNVVSTPTELVAMLAWDDKLMEVSDVIGNATRGRVDPRPPNQHELLKNSVTKQRNFYGVPIRPPHCQNHLEAADRKAGFKMSGHPKTWDAYTTSSRGAEGPARARCAMSMGSVSMDHQRQRSKQRVPLFINAMAAGSRHKDGKLHTDDPKVKEAVIKAMIYPTTATRRLYPRARQWNGRRTTTTRSSQDDRHGSRRHDLDRGGPCCRRAA